MCLGPGQGKSFIIITLANLLLDEDADRKVFISVANKLVYHQLLLDVASHELLANKITVLHGSDFSQVGPNDYLICDEADMYLKEGLMTFKNSSMTGLITAKQANLYLFSATIDENDESMLKTNFPDIEILHMKTALEISGEAETSYNVSGRFWTDSIQALDDMRKEVRLWSEKKPAIVFTSDHQTDVWDAIEESLKNEGHGIEVFRVDTYLEALQQRQLASDATKGVWLVNREWSRGFDLKLADESKVFIFDIYGKLPIAEIMQMTGRASRSQNVCKSRVWCVTERP